jgi:hypothetical protein
MRSLRPGADFEYAANRHFVEINVEAFLDDVSEVDAPPTHDTILDWVGRGFHNPLQLFFCSGDSFGRGPGALPLISPAAPFALNR